jgi:predicted DNA-binding transcriptional regulator AlpA
VTFAQQQHNREGASIELLLLKPAEAARALGISPRTLWGLADLPRVRIGRSVRYDVEDLRKWIAARKST